MPIAVTARSWKQRGSLPHASLKVGIKKSVRSLDWWFKVQCSWSKTGREIEPQQVTPQNQLTQGPSWALPAMAVLTILNSQQTPLSGKKQVKTWGLSRSCKRKWSAVTNNSGQHSKQLSEKDKQPGIDPCSGSDVPVPIPCCSFHHQLQSGSQASCFWSFNQFLIHSLQRVRGRQVRTTAERAAPQCERHRNISVLAAVGCCLPGPFLSVAAQAEHPWLHLPACHPAPRSSGPSPRFGCCHPTSCRKEPGVSDPEPDSNNWGNPESYTTNSKFK